MGNTRTINRGQTLHIVVSFRQEQRGRYQGRLEITVQNASQRSFLIIRELRAIVGNAADHDLLKAVAPYVHRRPSRWRHDTPVVAGMRPPALDAVRWVKKPEQSYIPSNLSDILKLGSTRKAIAAIRGGFLPPTLSSETHDRFFRALLWIEEYRLR